MMMPVPLKGGGRPMRPHYPDELHVAVLTGRCKRIKNLLKKGVHIESVNDHGQTPLFCAAWGGDVEVVQLLLGLGANPNRRCGSSGATPVHAATYRGSRRVLRLLIEAGADLSVRDSANLTPRDYAERQPHPIRRQKILAFLDLVLSMTLHRTRGLDLHRSSGRKGVDCDSPSSNTSTLPRRPLAPSESRLALNKSTLSLSKKSVGSVSSVWGACVGISDPRDRPPTSPARPTTELGAVKPASSVANLNKTVSCHLLDQLCVTTSLPLLSPDQLQRPTVPGTAYTCGGPTVYSPYSWLGTPVTVRRPTPALTIAKDNKSTGSEGKPDQDAVLSLLEELAILRRLRHPAFLEVMAACHVTDPSPDHVTLVFQHVPHGSLYHHLHVMHRDLSMGGAVDILVGVVEGLLFLHAHGWLHSGLSSHALHLVSTSHAKLGSFQHAIQQQAKGGCSMKADELGRATWLVPWQAPEVISEAMVSIKSEVYGLATIIWEIWSGMPPWCGVPDSEIKRRVSEGESLPYLTGAPPSLVMYLTQYGLKWNAHERDLDFHEIHTMLRSLRVQVEEDERVPAVTAWAPPSLPNTPIIGRNAPQNLADNPNNPHFLRNRSSITSNDNLRPSSSSYPSTSARSSSEIHPSQYLQFVTIDQLSSSSSCSSVHLQGQQIPQDLAEGINTLPSKVSVEINKSSGGRGHLNHQLSAVQVHEKPIERCVEIQNIAHVTSCPRNAIKPSSVLMTSTPARSMAGRAGDLPPDLLPSKFRPAPHMPPGTPDILSRELGSLLRPFSQPAERSAASPVSTGSDKENFDADGAHVQEFAYISNRAKRAFFSESENSSKAPSPVDDKPPRVNHHRHSVDGSKTSSPKTFVEKEVVKERVIYNKSNNKFEAQDVKRSIRTDVVRKGLSLSNLLNIGGGSMVTRTISHISLCSAEGAASPGGEVRRPQRTISQVTLTFKKLSTTDSSSSSSRDELEEAVKGDNRRDTQHHRRSTSLTNNQQQAKSPRHWDEVTAIKPASHQLTRHSSSCSLSSGGPPSPVHQFVGGPGHSLLASAALKARSGSSLPTSPQRKTSTAKTSESRPSSCYGVGAVALTEAVRINPRHDSSRHRHRRGQRSAHIEPEEEFIDDEFNAALYEQPHMQLSVGSSENLLDARLSTTSVMADDSGLFRGCLPRRLDDVSLPCEQQACATAYETPLYASRLSGHSVNASRHILNALPENSDEDLSLTSLTLRESSVPDNQSTRQPHSETACSILPESREAAEKISSKSDEASVLPSTETDSIAENSSMSVKDSDSVASFSPSMGDFRKEYEPLQSVLLLRSMQGKGLSLYLPKHSLGSDDSETEVL